MTRPPNRSWQLIGIAAVLLVAVVGGWASSPTVPEQKPTSSPEQAMTPSAEVDEDQVDEEALKETNGTEALVFRHLQMVDENGRIPPNALIKAKAQRDLMQASGRANAAARAEAGITRASWGWLGPGNIGGRVLSILINPSTPTTMWAGSATGGIFKTTNGGTSWSPLDDFMANLAVSSLVAHPASPNTIYAATGEYAGTNLAKGNQGAGVFKSVNGGTSWSQLSSTTSSDWYYANHLAIDPTSSTTLLAGTWTGIFKSTNGGANWTHPSLPGTSSVIMDVDFDPANGNNAIAGSWGGSAYYSTDGGDGWHLATGLPAANGSARVEVAYYASTPSIVYASVNLNLGTSANPNRGALYRSIDGGHSYSFSGPSSVVDYLAGQGTYGNTLWVSPTNPNRVIVGGVDLYQSTDQGATMTKISDWALHQNHVQTGVGPDSAHADHHVIVNNPNYPTDLTVYFGTDGGIFKTSNVTTVTTTTGWQELNNNLGITQFYGASGSTASGKIVGGTQDNGTLRYNGSTETWNMTAGGDGGFTASDPANSNYHYGEYVYGSVFRSADGGACPGWTTVTPTNSCGYISGLTGYNTDGTFVCAKASQYEIADMCNQTANFIAPFVMDPSNPQRLLVGGVQLWRTNDVRAVNTSITGPTWTAIKVPCACNSNGTSSPISAIAIDDHDSNIVYVGHNNGIIYRTTNATASPVTWTRVDLDAMPSRMVLGLTIDPSNPDVVYALFSGFSSDNVYRLSDGNMNWTDRTGSGATGLPDVPVRSLVVNPNNPAWLYLGTEIGVFTSQDAGLTWNVPNDGPANVPVDELFVMGDKLVAATFGRGVFRADLVASPTPFTDIGSSPFKSDIEWVYLQGITSGCTATTYCPLAPVTRGQMASFLARALHLSGSAPNAFTDDNGSIHEPNINLVAQAGIASGCGGTNFCPNGLVSREQMASFLARALHLSGPAPDAFTDDNTSIHETNINLVAREGIATGCGGTNYCPTLNVTRGQMAAFLHRAFGP